MDALKRLLMKKQQEGRMLSPIEKDAKMSVLKNLHKDMSESMADKLGGLKKVTVAADTNEDLGHGLDKAKEVLEKAPGHDEDEMMSDDDLHGDDDENSESPEEEAAEEMMAKHDDDNEDDEDMSHMSEEELDAKLKQLMALKASRHA